jgi:hypothetical protein
MEILLACSIAHSMDDVGLDQSLRFFAHNSLATREIKSTEQQKPKQIKAASL